MEQNWITSIGLDIGTSTTKFIVSRLLIDQTKNRFSLPGIRIIDRQVQYMSPVYTTPLLNQLHIDMNALADLLEKEYKASGISLQNVKAGAVIITGETARKENAETIIHYLAEKAGDFVVATAGNDLEGVLAGKGSGAMKRSNQIEGIIANVDIGGGTANVALFRQGKAIHTFTFHVGGRLIRFTDTGEIEYVSDFIQPWLDKSQVQLKIGQIASYNQIYEIGKQMGESLLEMLTGKPSELSTLLLAAPLFKQVPAVQEIWFSGGVAQMMEQPRPLTMRDVTKHGDMGPLLAHAIQEAAAAYPLRIQTADETTRATVIGAGMQNTEVSGATVFVNPALLPIKNIPILPIPVESSEGWDLVWFQNKLNKSFLQAKDLYNRENNPPFAVALSHITYCTYKMLQHLADTIQNGFHTHFPEASLVIVICENDMAKALGQALAKKNLSNQQIICIDQVDFSHGDYIDLGLPIADEAISVSIKTLAFS